MGNYSLVESIRFAFFMRGFFVPSETAVIGYNIEKYCQRRCERYCLYEGGVMEDIRTCPIGTICRGPVVLTQKMKVFIEKFNKNYRKEADNEQSASSF